MSNLFDFSSLAMIPTAYKDGKLYSIRPVPEYGAELVTNGDFATDSDWTKGTGTTISGGTANFSNANGVSLYQNIGTQSGNVHVTFSVTNYTSGTLNVYSGGNESVSTINVAANSVGIYSANINRSGGNANIIFGSSDNFTGSIDNVSFKEVIVSDGDFTFTRGSNLSATRVDVNGLIEKGRENLFTNSNNFGSTSWAGSVIETSGQSGYNGTNDAWLIENAANGKYIRQDNTSSGVLTASVYAKAGNVNWLRFAVSNSPVVSVYFDLVNGVSSFPSNVISQTIVSVGNGWYRLSATFLANSMSGMQFYPADGANDLGETGDNIFLQDAQLESGLVATPYIETGASTAQAGILENTPRFDYSGGATCPSLLLEPSRSNQITQSEYFGGWTVNTTITANAALSPEGVQNAYNIASNSGVGNGILAISGALSSTQYICSIYVKSAGATTGKLRLFDGSTGASTTTTFTPTSEWQRVEVTRTSGAGTFQFRTDIHSNDGDLLIYGAQLEAGSYSTSYIPTYGVSQTRAFDDCAVNYTNISDTGGTIFWQGFVDIGVDSHAISLSNSANGNGSNRILIYRSTSDNKAWLYIQSAGVSVKNISLQLPTDSNDKYAVSWATNDFAVYINGAQIYTSSSGAIPTGMQYIQLNEWTNAHTETNVTKQALYFTTRLSNLDLAILTGATTYNTFAEMALALNYTVYE